MIFDEVPMVWSLPAIVNFHEATAFATWKTRQVGPEHNFRPISELEHNCIRNTSQKVSDHNETIDDVVTEDAVGSRLLDKAS